MIPGVPSHNVLSHFTIKLLDFNGFHGNFLTYFPIFIKNLGVGKKLNPVNHSIICFSF